MGAAVLSVAFADDGYVTDEDDSPGPLDIARFGFFQESSGGHLTVDLYEDLDPALLDEEHNWIGFILEDDIVNDGYVNAVFVKYAAGDLEAGLYGPGRGGPDSQRFIEDVEVEMVDADTVDVFLDDREYAAFHHWYAQTSFETIGEDDRGYPGCNWEAPPPRPTPAVGKCLDESNSVQPTIDESPHPTVTSTPSDPPCAFRQSQCRKRWVSIRYKEESGVFRGRVHTGENDRCLNHRRVLLERVLGAGDVKRVGSDETTHEGYWRVPLKVKTGRFRARVLRAEKDAGEFSLGCKSMVSVTIRP